MSGNKLLRALYLENRTLEDSDGFPKASECRLPLTSEERRTRRTGRIRRTGHAQDAQGAQEDAQGAEGAQGSQSAQGRQTRHPDLQCISDLLGAERD